MYTKQEAAECIKKFFLDNCPRQYLSTPIDEIDFTYFAGNASNYVRWEVSFRVECTLCFDLRSVNVTWASGGGNLITCHAVLSLYRMVVDFASMLETVRQEEMSEVARSEKRG